MADVTSRYDFPFQESTDSPDGPQLGQELAEKVEEVIGFIEDTRITPAVDDIESLETYRPLIDQRSTTSSANSTTLVTAFSVTLPATGTYAFDLMVALTNSGAVGRPGFALGGTSTPTAWRWVSGTVHYNSATASQGNNANGTSYPGSTSGTALVNSDFTTSGGYSWAHIRGTVTVSATGTLTFRFSEASGSGTVNIQAGSLVTVQRVS